jgi:hypothetical protein
MSNFNTQVNQLKWDDFLTIKNSEHHVVTFEIAYVDMCGGSRDAAILLSQIVYWYLPDKQGHPTKLRVFKKGHYWLAKQLDEWWSQTRLTANQVRNSLAILKNKGLIITDVMRFNCLTTTHIRINEKVFVKEYTKAIYKILQDEEKENTKTSPSRKKEINEPFPDGNYSKTQSRIYSETQSINRDYTTETTSHTILPNELAGECNEKKEFEESEASPAAPSFSSLGKENHQEEEDSASAANPQDTSQPTADIGGDFCTEDDHYFFRKWEEKYDCPYPWPEKNDPQYIEILDNLDTYFSGGMEGLIDLYFKVKFRKPTNHRVFHFLDGDIIKLLGEKIRCPESVSNELYDYMVENDIN